MRFAAVIPSAGKSVRMGGIKKENIIIGGKTVLERSAAAFDDFDQVVIVGPSGTAAGGSTRQESVRNGILALDDDIDYVLIHDGARPFVSREIVTRVKEALLAGHDAVIPCVRPKDTIRTADRTLDRSGLYMVQTPQGFRLSLYKACMNKAAAEGFEATDDASIVEHYGFPVHIVEGDYANKKITTRDDLPDGSGIRFGSGYDLHLLEKGRPLMLGCIQIPFESGLVGHSDADVIAHAIADALLGAAALGDIGKIFPDNSADTLGISGSYILSETVKLLRKNGFEVNNVDATLIAQRPKIAPYTEKMREAVAEALSIDKSCVSVKATTEEGVGPTGEGIAMAAYAAAVICRAVSLCEPVCI